MKNAGCNSELLLQDAKTYEVLYLKIKEKIIELEEQVNTSKKDMFSKANFYADIAEKTLLELRKVVDKAEELVANEFWPMAKYQELLTIL